MDTANKYTKKRLNEIAQVERPIKGKIYPVGVILVPKVGRPTPEIIEHQGEVPPKFYVLVPKGLPSYYLLAALERYLEDIAKRMQTINLPFESLASLPLTIHTDWATINAIDTMARKIITLQKQEGSIIENLKQSKKFLLDNMMC